MMIYPPARIVALAIIIAGLVGAAFNELRIAGGAPDACAADYAQLYDSFEWSRSGHISWAQYLDANTGYDAGPTIGTVAQQWALVQLYDWREWAAWYLANGDQTWLEWLRYSLAGPEGRGGHQSWVDYLTAYPDAPASITAETFGDGLAFQTWAVSMYDWRIALVNAMTRDCA